MNDTDRLAALLCDVIGDDVVADNGYWEKEPPEYWNNAATNLIAAGKKAIQPSSN